MDINLQRLNTATTNYREHTDKRYLMVIKCVESHFNLEGQTTEWSKEKGQTMIDNTYT
jgi:hypothetical protein